MKRFFKKGDICMSGVNYRKDDGLRAGAHKVVVIKDNNGAELTECRMITHSTAGTNEKLNEERIKGDGWRPDNGAYITKDIFNAVTKFMKKKKGARYE